jgi:hypothetical protein
MVTVSEFIMLRHTIINIDNKCLDLLLTEDEIVTAFNRALDHNNHQYINQDICCKCWPINTTIECCPFWKKILGLCEHCEEENTQGENCNGQEK